MAVVIRLKRTGGKKDVSFRLVVADSRRARDGRFIEQLGFYDPKPLEAQYKVDLERTQYWLGVGATCSDQVRSLLKKAGVPFPSRAKKPKKASADKPAAKSAKRAKGAKAKPASAREQARRVRKKADRVARKARAVKAKSPKAAKAKSGEAPAATA
jgi:small subunit ribosomal protein S16